MDRLRTAVVVRSREVGWAAVDAALAKVDGLRLVGEASTAERGLELAQELRPDILFASAVIDGERFRPLVILGMSRKGRTRPRSTA